MEYGLIIYNCCYNFEDTWAKALQKAIFFLYGFRRDQSPTYTICHKHHLHLKKKMAVQTPRSRI